MKIEVLVDPEKQETNAQLIVKIGKEALEHMAISQGKHRQSGTAAYEEARATRNNELNQLLERDGQIAHTALTMLGNGTIVDERELTNLGDGRH